MIESHAAILRVRHRIAGTRRGKARDGDWGGGERSAICLECPHPWGTYEFRLIIANPATTVDELLNLPHISSSASPSFSLTRAGETYISVVSAQSLGRWNGTMGASGVFGSDLS